MRPSSLSASLMSRIRILSRALLSDRRVRSRMIFTWKRKRGYRCYKIIGESHPLSNPTVRMQHMMWIQNVFFNLVSLSGLITQDSRSFAKCFSSLRRPIKTFRSELIQSKTMCSRSFYYLLLCNTAAVFKNGKVSSTRLLTMVVDLRSFLLLR